jgi:pantothenate synthetase
LEIDEDQTTDLNQRKNELKNLLDLYPISWTDYWKLCSKQGTDATFNPEQLYKQILQEIRRRPWKQQISLLETQIKNTSNELDKTKLATELIEANKILRKL